MTSYTNNFGFSLQGFGENANTWGLAGTAPYPNNPGPGLNSGVFTPLDAILGANISIAISAGNNSISFQQWQNKIFILTGTLTANATVNLPISPNSIGSATAVGGEFVVVNQTTGNFTVTVQTAATGSVGVFVPQSKYSLTSTDTYLASLLYSDGVNVRYADKGSPGFAQAVNGNPNGLIAGVAGGVNTNAQLAYDYTNGLLYVCTTTGIANGTGQAVWGSAVAGGQSIPQPEGYLTLTNSTPIITTDTTNTQLFYTPFQGSWAAINSGSSITPFRFSQLPLQLSSAQAAGQIYDVFLIYSGGTPGVGTPVIATGVGWSVATAGSGSRGASASIGRDTVSGLWVNAQIQSMIYNNGTISGPPATVPPGGGVYLGSIQIDAGANGTITCNRSYGQSRKWGVWNAYSRQPIILTGGDPTASWVYTGAFRFSNNNVSNFISSFMGLQEEQVSAAFIQKVALGTLGQNGVGFNSSTTPFGVLGNFQNSNAGSVGGNMVASLINLPQIGSNNYNMLESGGGGGSTFFGAAGQMQLSITYRG